MITAFFLVTTLLAAAFISRRIKTVIRLRRLTNPEDYARRSQFASQRADDELAEQMRAELGARYGQRS